MKIINGNKSILIIKRENGKEYEAIINHISQPYYGINFRDGKPTGGYSMTEIDKQMLIAKVKKANEEENANFIIEEEISA